MLPATPPRLMTRWSTRKDSETRSIWSARSWSANRPGKWVRWSVAMDPVTAIGTLRQPTGGLTPTVPAVTYRSRPGLRLKSLIERVAAGAAAARVRVVDGESLLLDRV